MLANNNLPLKIYCENIVIAFLNFNLLFFIFFPLYFLLFFSSFFPPLFFSSTHVPLLFSFFSFFPLFSLPLPPNSRSFHRALSLSLSLSLLIFNFLIFFLPFSLFSYHFVHKFLSLYPIKTHKLKGHTQPYGEACSKEERMA